MSTTRKTPKLDALTAWLANIGGRYSLEIVPESQETADKIDWLKKGGRDFLKVTPGMQSQVLRFLKQDVSAFVTGGGNIRTEATLATMGEAAKKYVLLRFANNGNDVRMNPLSPRYAAYKRKKGLASNIGEATLALENAVERAQFVWRKRG